MTYSFVILVKIDITHWLVCCFQLSGQGIERVTSVRSHQLVCLDISGSGHMAETLNMHGNNALSQVEGVVDRKTVPFRVTSHRVAHGSEQNIAHVMTVQWIIALETYRLGAVQYCELACSINY